MADLTQFSENYPEILRNLKLLYGKKLLEIEQRYMFDDFYGESLRRSDFEAKPMVMLLGQYSVSFATVLFQGQF
jgi:hypothetical protein